jgi:hypothetical protein
MVAHLSENGPLLSGPTLTGWQASWENDDTAGT